MDNLTHTLFGYAMARAGAERWSRGATATLILSANLPDAEALFQPDLGPGSYLIQHRGLSHSFVGIAILSIAFPMVVWLIAGFRRRPPSSTSTGPPLRWLGLFAATAVGLASHLFLDWLNTYGIRLLLPFDDRFFYGDIAYIIDPWMWLLLAAAGAWQPRRKIPGDVFWALTAIGTSLVVVLTGRAGATVLALWFVGLVLVLLGRARHWGSPRISDACLLLVFLHLSVLFGCGSHAANLGRRDLLARGIRIEALMTTPAPAVPWRWTVLAQGPERLYRAGIDTLEGAVGSWESVPRNLDDPRLDAIRDTLAWRALEVFYRFPYVEPGIGSPVWLRDARYSWGEWEGFSDLKVPLPPDN